MATQLAPPQFKFKKISGNFFFFPGVEAHFPSNFSVKSDIQKSVDSVAYLIQSDLEAFAASFDHHSKIKISRLTPTDLVHVLPIYFKNEKQQNPAKSQQKKVTIQGKNALNSKTNFKAHFSDTRNSSFL